MKKLFYIAILLLIMAPLVCTVAGGERVEMIAPLSDAVNEDETPVLFEVPITVVYTCNEEEPEICPITATEIEMLAKVMYKEGQGICWNGDYCGVTYTARQAAIAWCALNIYDAGGRGDTLAEVLSRPGQFAYDPDAPVTDYMFWLAEDVVARWWAEKLGETDVGRTLPADYIFFGGDGRENHFRKECTSFDELWDWSCYDPYVGVAR